MRKLLASLAVTAMLAGTVLPADAALAQSRQHRGDQQSARAEMAAGRNMPIREIERRIIGQMPGREYLGFEYDRTAQAYRLKFIEKGKVVWVDVDAQTARIIRVSR